MAKKLYEEEKISNIAIKIKEFVPFLKIDGFSTNEMADGVGYVHEAGKSIGRAEGYDMGYADGYNKASSVESGVKLPTLTNPGAANDLLSGKQLIDGEGYIVEGAVPTRTSADLKFERLGKYDLGLTVTSGYYGEGVSKIIDVEPYYDEGYDAGLNDGKSLNTYEDGNEVAY